MPKQITPTDRHRLAEAHGLSSAYLYQCLTGRRDMEPVKARRLEVESKGELTRQMLCHKTYAGIWYELAPKIVKRANGYVGPSTRKAI